MLQVLFSVITTVYSPDYDLGRKVFYWLLLITFVFLFPSKSKKSFKQVNINLILKGILLLICIIQLIVVMNLLSNKEILAFNLISRDDFFHYDYLTNLHGGKIPFMLRFYFRQIAMLATLLIVKRKFSDFMLVYVFWISSIVISIVSGGRFVFLELLLFFVTIGISKKALKYVLAIGLATILGLTYGRTGGFDSLYSSLIGLDFAYEVSKLSPDFGYFSRLGIFLDNLKGMSSWSWIKYGTFLDEFLYFNPVLNSSFNAYGTIFIIPLAETGIIGFTFFLFVITMVGWLLRDTSFSDSFVLMLIMGLFQFNLLWYPVVYLFLFVTFTRLINVK